MPGYKEKNVRLSLFVDAGNVWGPDDKVSAADVRVVDGHGGELGLAGGPAAVLLRPCRSRTRPGDKIERFQFQLGGSSDSVRLEP